MVVVTKRRGLSLTIGDLKGAGLAPRPAAPLPGVSPTTERTDSAGEAMCGVRAGDSAADPPGGDERSPATGVSAGEPFGEPSGEPGEKGAEGESAICT